ncbi:MAG: hypothetical protein IPI33_17415 [Dehalococcoidia bacterium]|nr:hypothetical protein [Dehalococcoidia bacterium]
MSDPVERAMYVQRVARHLGISEDAVLERLRSALVSRPGPGRAQPIVNLPLNPEDVLLALLIRHPALRQFFRNYPRSLFSGALEREIFTRWLGDEDFARQSGTMTRLSPVSEYWRRSGCRHSPRPRPGKRRKRRSGRS